MLPAVIPAPAPSGALDARRDIILWTTKDGREVPLDEMSDDHIANALRVLSLWRSRLKKQDGDAATVKDLGQAIDRFKLITRQRRKAAAREDGAAGKGGFRKPAFRRG